jgi:hypothetical protein
VGKSPAILRRFSSPFLRFSLFGPVFACNPSFSLFSLKKKEREKGMRSIGFAFQKAGGKNFSSLQNVLGMVPTTNHHHF